MSLPVRSRGVRVVVGAALLCVLTGCSASSAEDTPRHDTSAALEASATVNRATAVALGAFAQDWMFSDEFSAEPEGDLVDSDSPVYVYIASATAEPATVSFDVAQIYKWEAADREAALDGEDPPPNAVYGRNRYKHIQQLPVRGEPRVILQVCGGSVEGDEALAIRENYVGLTTVTFDEFCSRLQEYPDQYRDDAAYWLITDGEAVYGIMQQYFP
ncbi:MAG: hypothetical protein QMC79_08435 [Anaerosomatales bacterium]|nr:hypothetical protein [Anaerosomatales bacterium]